MSKIRLLFGRQYVASIPHCAEIILLRLGFTERRGIYTWPTRREQGSWQLGREHPYLPTKTANTKVGRKRGKTKP
jgi:hypothetical protein